MTDPNFKDKFEIWKHPSDYGGFSPDGDGLIYVRNRDSSILENSNWDVLEDIFEDQPEQHLNGDIPSGEESYVYTFRASHWAVGWVEYMLIRQDAPQELINKAADLVAGLEGYPVVDDMYYSRMQDEAVTDYWRDELLRYRIEMCADADVSIFAARREDDIPTKVYEDLIQSEMFY